MRPGDPCLLQPANCTALARLPRRLWCSAADQKITCFHKRGELNATGSHPQCKALPPGALCSRTVLLEGFQQQQTSDNRMRALQGEGCLFTNTSTSLGLCICMCACQSLWDPASHLQTPPPPVQRGAAEGQGDIYPVAPRSAALASCTRLRGRSKFPLSMNYGVQTPALGIQLWGPTAVQNQCAGSNGVGERKQG